MYCVRTLLLATGAALAITPGCVNNVGLGSRWDGAQAGDLGDNPDGLPHDPGGPAIVFLVPKQDATVIGDSLKVQVKITDPDGVDDTTVKLTVQ
jgi:hypothetical protein